MEKIVKRYGSALIIRFDNEDIKIHNLKEGDHLDLEVYKIGKEKSR